MKYCLFGISRHLAKKFGDSFGFGLKGDVFDERRVQIDLVERFDAARILYRRWGPCNGIDKPRLAANIARIKNGLAIALEYCCIIRWRSS